VEAGQGNCYFMTSRLDESLRSESHGTEPKFGRSTFFEGTQHGFGKLQNIRHRG
jgi:hypothetical protein